MDQCWSWVCSSSRLCRPYLRCNNSHLSDSLPDSAPGLHVPGMCTQARHLMKLPCKTYQRHYAQHTIQPSTLSGMVKWVSASGWVIINGDGGCTFLAAYRRAYGSSPSSWYKGQLPSGAVLHSSHEPGELMQWLWVMTSVPWTLSRDYIIIIIIITFFIITSTTIS